MSMKWPAMVLPILTVVGCAVHEHRETTPGRTPVAVEYVVAMARADVNDWHIVSEIHRNGVYRTPTADDIVAMKQAGASDEVVRAMISAPVMPYVPAETRVVRHYDPSPGINAAVTGIALWAIFAPRHVHYRSRCR